MSTGGRRREQIPLMSQSDLRVGKSLDECSFSHKSADNNCLHAAYFGVTVYSSHGKVLNFPIHW